MAGQAEVRIWATFENLSEFDKFLATFGKAPKFSRTGEALVGNAVRRGFQENFTKQATASQRWPPLAQRTVRERISLGFPGRRPILIRTHEYESSWTQKGHQNHHEKWKFRRGLIQAEFGSKDYRVAALSGALPHIPDRSVHRLGRNAIRKIRGLFIEALRREYAKRGYKIKV